MVVTVSLWVLTLAAFCLLVAKLMQQNNNLRGLVKDLRIDMNVCQTGQNRARMAVEALDKLCRDTEQSRYAGQKDMNDRISPLEIHIKEEREDRAQIVERLELLEKESLTVKRDKPQTEVVHKPKSWRRAVSLLEAGPDESTS